MKKHAFLFIAFLLVGVGVSAQESRPFKRVENQIQAGAGLFLETGKDYRIKSQNPGIVLRLSYGLDIRLSDHWSVMPGAGIRAQMGGIFGDSWDKDNMTLADCFVTARYHLESAGHRIVFGLGPAFSYMLSPVRYHESNFTGEKYRRSDIGIQPSVTFLRGEHFQWGLEANIGLKDLRIVYMDLNTPFSPTYLNYLALTCGWRF